MSSLSLSLLFQDFNYVTTGQDCLKVTEESYSSKLFCPSVSLNAKDVFFSWVLLLFGIYFFIFGIFNVTSIKLFESFVQNYLLHSTL